MVITYNADANFTDVDNSEWDSGLKALGGVWRAYRMEEASGTTLTDTGYDFTDGVRSAGFTRVTGAFTDTYATRGSATYTDFNSMPWDAAMRDNRSNGSNSSYRFNSRLFIKRLDMGEIR